MDVCVRDRSGCLSDAVSVVRKRLRPRLRGRFIMAFDDFTKMHVWQMAFQLLIKIYEITKKFPSEEKFGLVSDMRRAANSIVHNIAEGFGRYEPRDKTRFYKISRGSL